MTIKIGEGIPEVTLQVMGESGPEGVTSGDFFSNKRVVLFALPGAFTPTCSARHLPGFIAAADDMKAKGKAAGATGWMVKPFDPNKLLDVTKRVLG